MLMDDEKLGATVLKLVSEGEADGVTCLELLESLSFDKSKRENWKKLKRLLMDLEDRELIEERHFKDSGRVDYAICSKGIDFLNKRGRTLS